MVFARGRGEGLSFYPGLRGGFRLHGSHPNLHTHPHRADHADPYTYGHYDPHIHVNLHPYFHVHGYTVGRHRYPHADGIPDRHFHGHALTNADIDLDGHPYHHPNINGYPVPDVHAYGHLGQYLDVHLHCDPHLHPDPHGDGHVHAHTHIGKYINAHGHRYTNHDPISHGNGHIDTFDDSYVVPHPNGNSVRDADAHVDIHRDFG